MTRAITLDNAQAEFDRLDAMSKMQELSDYASTRLARAMRVLGMSAPDLREKWTPEQDAYLCDCLADGHSFATIGAGLGKSKNSCIGRFSIIKRQMGWQAQ